MNDDKYFELMERIFGVISRKHIGLDETSTLEDTLTDIGNLFEEYFDKMGWKK